VSYFIAVTLPQGKNLFVVEIIIIIIIMIINIGIIANAYHEHFLSNPFPLQN
jgi:hypothetical protein